MANPQFGDPARWEVVRDVNVFDEHADSKGGKVVRRFTREDLEKIAENCNRRDRVGQHCPLTLGHTRDEAPEDEQPEIVGYARRFRVAYDASLGRHVIRADYYLRRDRADDARGYPRISVEYWPDGKFFDPIALLRRTPQRDLGQWTYHRRGDAACLRYAMGERPMADEFEDRDRSPVDPPDKDAPSGEDRDDERRRDEPDDDDTNLDVEPEFHAKVLKCIRGKYKHLDRMHDDYAKKFGMADASQGNDFIPGAANDANDDDEEEDMGDGKGRDRETPPAKNRRAAEVLRMAKMEQELATLRKEVRQAREREAEAERLDALRRVRDLGYVIDPEKVLRQCRRMSDGEFADHIDFIRETVRRDPAAGPDLPVAAQSAAARYAADRRAERDDPEEFTADDLDRAHDYMRKHPGCDWDEAEKYARESRPKRFAAGKNR